MEWRKRERVLGHEGKVERTSTSTVRKERNRMERAKVERIRRNKTVLTDLLQLPQIIRRPDLPASEEVEGFDHVLLVPGKSTA